MQTSAGQTSAGFNLNLLECKCIFCGIACIFDVCFNLNLLECKFKLINSAWVTATVLISTYWNVNVEDEINSMTDVQGFNLNLLECKWWFNECYRKYTYQVLISTYWNVNKAVWIWEIFQAAVLISTYWNVNSRGLVFLIRFNAVLISTYWNVNERWKSVIRNRRLF